MCGQSLREVCQLHKWTIRTPPLQFKVLTSCSPREIGSNVNERTSRLARCTPNQHRKSDEEAHTQYAGAEWEDEWTGAVPSDIIGWEYTGMQCLE